MACIYNMNEHIILHVATVALIIVMVYVKFLFQQSEYKARNLLYSKIQTMFDKAINFNAKKLFQDYHLVEPYNPMVELYCTCNFNEHLTPLQLARSKLTKLACLCHINFSISQLVGNKRNRNINNSNINKRSINSNSNHPLMMKPLSNKWLKIFVQ